MRERLIEQIRNYKPYNKQEAMDKEVILKCLMETEDIFKRSNSTMHMTASAWTVNEEMDRVLMIYHNIYNSWSWLGGHADGDEDLLAVAIREAKEESGIKSIRPYSEDILSLEVLTVNGHIKNGNYVPSHLHINISYLLVADDKEELIIKPDENSGVGWFTLSGAISSSNEEWFRDRIYSKLNEKLAIIKESR
ncbi:MAG: NUDIX hydrolase [Agathobacter sp.]|nr:NUDIX hydrolase [Agathobacter sp.]